MAHILIIRFSAINDVAMTIPIIYSLATQYPQHQIMVLSKDIFAPLFEQLPDNVIFRGIDLRGEYAGLMGLGWLYNDLKEEKFDAVADFQNTFRSKYLRWRFYLTNCKTAHWNKEHRGQLRLIHRKHKVMVCQKSVFHRYTEVLEKIGYPVQLNFISLFGEKKGNIRHIFPLTGDKEGHKWIGIAPFATHVGKIYPLSKEEQVIEQLTTHKDVKLFLFGRGQKEKEVLEKWEKKFPNVISTTGKLTLSLELAFMSHLDVMLTMDSVYLYLASLVNIPIVSIWGATHPYAGYTEWRQRAVHTVQVELPCRPCSLSGNKRCLKGDYNCLQKITPDTIIKHIENIIG